jgi:hypothetical protein
MTAYRCFLLGQGGKAVSVEKIDAETDWEAIELARVTLERHTEHSAFELWRETRCIFMEPKKPAAG